MSTSKRQARDVALFFEACGKGDAALLSGLLANDPTLARLSNPEGHHDGWTGLHSAAQRGHVDAVRLLLEHGADPNAREAGDNTYALHWAAAHGHVSTVRALLDAGGDVHGIGDVHELDVVGWATGGPSLRATSRGTCCHSCSSAALGITSSRQSRSETRM